MSTARLVSVVVPCRNEAAHVDAFVASVLAQRLPDGVALELIVADGASDDGTRERLAALAAREPRLTVIDNPQRIVATGLNRALAAARGDVVVRMDVHTTYTDDYVAQCLVTLARTGADNVGGPWRAEGTGPWGRAIAAAFQSRWAAGGARSRSLSHDGPVDTVYLGCWPRATFERFGGFDETLVRNQDDEHNLRIVRGGGRVWQSPAIRSTYHPRESLAAFARQWLQYGYWKPFVMRKHGQPASARHLLPGAFVAALALSAAAALLGLGALPLAALVAVYTLAVFALAVDAAARSSWTLLPRLPVVIATQQLAYGAGTLLGAWDAWRHGRGRERFARLTR
ncbi:glycosyltransferase family 2 protein [Calidifontimicrobium sp. SYSU G02091]|uniref:glycosyltransferase family 2 protein n=1 Tax=Calidifontimicrobium sp. SYSU G02091 TaxID=2926421 RepID=UPI001F5388A1|nr:glycosyltransferase family 2 protein [Calidifontimicrobium sp. SYSU G02091]MCI1190567.1 glycosyltransferase family 2 protein [Calidifontimicrobium sp. SYSU G02091]